MSDQETKGPVILNSSIEFAVTGPLGGRDRVLAKSKDAGLDLIGLAVLGSEKPKTERNDVLAVLFGGPSPVNVVSSFPLYDLEPATDNRRSSFSFAWKGFASPLGLQTIQETLNLQLTDLHRAIKKRDPSEIEWALGPVVYRCVRANERRLLSRRFLKAFALTYVAIGLLAALAGLLSFAIKFLSSSAIHY